jgi:HTH-type transcriptional regulator / antitoxin HipB
MPSQKTTDREKMVVVNTPLQIGQLVRQRRKEAGLTLKDAAAMAGVGVRFLSELERGKSTLQLGLAIHILQLFGFELRIEQRGSNV